jgi:hypothetical protein
MHYLNGFTGQPNFVKITSLPEIDPFASPEKRIEQMTAFFKVFEQAFNKGKDKEPVYVNVPCFIKVIADFKKGTRYVTPEFVGQGFIEVAKLDDKGKYKKPAIEIKPGESIVLNMNATKDTPSDIATDTGDDLSNLPPEVRAAMGK